MALQLLTVIPITRPLNLNGQQLGRSVLFYPIIGWLIGCLLVAELCLISSLALPIQATLILMGWVLLTGGLHLDGLADCADAWVGGFGNKQRSLAIMKDPSAGPMAVLVLILILLLKWSIISNLIEKQLISTLLFSPLLGRLAILMLMTTSNYISTDGLATQITAHLPKFTINGIILLHLLITLFFVGVLPILSLLLVVFLLRWQANKRLGGMNGDVYGAAVELVEVSVLLSTVL